MNKGKFTSIKFGKDAIDSVYVGVRMTAEATATTLGPAGKNVMIERDYQASRTSIIHDGINVALTVNLEDPFARNGANVMKEAGKRQRDICGDGTTACSILTMAILDEVLKVTASGINPMTLRRGLESGSKKVIQQLSTISMPVKTLKQKQQIATISAEDEELGKLIAEVVHKVGDSGVITVDQAKSGETTVDYQEGMQVDRGYIHPFMVTDHERQTAVLDDVAVLVTDYELIHLDKIGAFLDNVVFPHSKKVLFITPNADGDFLMAMIGAKVSGKFLPIVIRAPGVGTLQTNAMLDICALTGATFISKEAGHKFDDFNHEALGHADRVIASKLSTIIQGGAGHRDDVLARIASIEGQMKDETISAYDREQLKVRRAKLTDGIAVIKVGGQTEIELKERKERAIDAVQSLQAACKTGLVPGGETVYFNCLGVLDDSILGEKILKEALKAPFRRLVENGGYDSGELIAELKNQKQDMGFDVVRGEWVNLIEAGIIDAAEIPMTAVKVAVSVSTQLSSLGAAIVLNNE